MWCTRQFQLFLCTLFGCQHFSESFCFSTLHNAPSFHSLASNVAFLSATTKNTHVAASDTSTTTPSCTSSSSIQPEQEQEQKATRRKTRQLFQSAKQLEKQGKWNQASELYQLILQQDPYDAHSHLGYARLEARRSAASAADTNSNNKNKNNATEAFHRGTTNCPDSIHLWQAWAIYESSKGNIQTARHLFDQALLLDQSNPYVCHAFGLLEKKLGNSNLAQELWERPLSDRPTAALVCSLGELFISQQLYPQARELYSKCHASLDSEKDRTEVYLAAAWLEEKYCNNKERAKEWLTMALSPNNTNSRAQVALARLQGRTSGQEDATRMTLATTCRDYMMRGNTTTNASTTAAVTPTEDGRVFNAWASMEVKARKFKLARKILQQGMERFPLDKDLVQAAGGVEERIGNYSGARMLYAASLVMEPSAPTLLALTMLELRHPDASLPDFDRAKGLLDEALLLDPRHGPVYNAYGNMERRRGNVEEARRIYKQGIQAECTDPASVFHGLAQLELALGNVAIARMILNEGLRQVESQSRFMDSSRHERAIFLVHTLGMIELNTNRAVVASLIFKEGIAKYGNSSQLLLGAALSEVKLGNEEKAREWFELAARSDKRHAQAWQAWGVMEMRAGHHAAAKALFEAGIKNSPRHGALYHAYGTMESRMGNLENARVLFKAGLVKCPNHVPLYQGWASVELRDGNLERAKKLIGEALTRDKTHGSGWLIAADIEERQGNSGLVGLLLRRGIECAPFDPSLYRAYGEYLIRNGKISDAREVLEKGLEVNPTHALLYHSLAELEARVFNLEGLAKLNKRAANIFSRNAMEPSAFSSQVFGDRMRDQLISLPLGDMSIGDEQGPKTSYATMTQLEDELFKFEDDS